jgi:hypothetical protein
MFLPVPSDPKLTDWDVCSRCGRLCSIRYARAVIAQWDAGARLDHWLCAACQREWADEIHRRRYRRYLVAWAHARRANKIYGPLQRRLMRRKHGIR